MVVDNPTSNTALNRDERRNVRLEELLTHDPQVRDARPLESVNKTIAASMPLSHIVASILEGYADRPALGQRAFDMVTDDATKRTTMHLRPEFETITYRQVDQQVNNLASAWYHDSEHGVRAGDFVDILGFTSSDYTVIDLACIRLGLVSVPLQTSAAVGQLAPIISETAPRILASSIDLLDTAVDSILAGVAPEILVVFDYNENDDDQRDVFDAARARLHDANDSVIVESLRAVLDRGDALPSAPLHTADEGENPMATIFYTSGSTGTPKGAIYTESMMATPWQAGAHFHGVELPPAIHINFMPMSHLYGRHWLTMTLATGGTAYFAAKSDLSTLFEDIRLVRPTAMNFVPRVCDMVFQHFQSELDKRATDGADADQVAEAVKADVRENFLGGRVVSAMCGTAPLSAEMASFIESCLDIPLDDGFGSTEAGMILVKGEVQRPPVIDYKLIDVPELGYFSTDAPHPRGELAVKTTSMFPGYYKRPEITAEMFDDDGYYLTGDVMAETGPDALVYVDRRKNVLKLSQGEFVAVSRLEALFVNSPLIRQIFVYGNSERAFLLAVVVPTADALSRNQNGGLSAAVNESIQQIAKSSGLNSYEIPRELIIETEPFTQENGLLSGVGKLLRPKLKEHYGSQLEQLYSDLADGQATEMRELRHVDLDQPTLNIVFRATHALLGCATEDLVPNVHFSDLGGDSLSALSFSNLLQEIFGVEVPVGIIISAATDLERLAQYIDDERNSGARRPSFATVHGADSTIAYASDLTLDKFIDAATLSNAPSLPRPHDTVRTVLLTGANGYLGRFLCLEWLERVAETDGTLICIVRGSTASAARKRLDDAFDSGDAELMSHYRTLAEKHLEVLAGDIGEPNLGLSEDDWSRLARSVDLIVHPAALVNHVLPYSQLFGPNVVGTAELVKIALTDHMKPINYLSTIAVASQVEPSAFEEDADIRLMSAERVVDDTYANGYGNSKWAGEVLLREAHDLCGLPVAVFRSDMILAHTKYTGQLNVPDIFTRLLLSVLATGIAPQSFYELDAQGNRQRAHYDGLPADFTAEAIATLGARTTDGLRNYDVMNPHDDGISLDEFVDWLIEAGHPISRIENYDEWFERFTTAIKAMPEEQKQHSLMPLLHAYTHPGPAVHGSEVPAKQFQSAVQDAEIGADKDIPHLTPELIAKYVADLKQLNLL